MATWKILFQWNLYNYGVGNPNMSHGSISKIRRYYYSTQCIHGNICEALATRAAYKFINHDRLYPGSWKISTGLKREYGYAARIPVYAKETGTFYVCRFIDYTKITIFISYISFSDTVMYHPRYHMFISIIHSFIRAY